MRRIVAFIIISMTTVLALGGCNLYTDLDRPGAAGDVGGVTDAADGGSPDTGDASTPINGCVPQSDLDFCNVEGADCGEITAFDNCESSRTVNCGTCTDGTTCGERQANVCGCPCEIDGECFAEGAINPGNSCEACDSVADPSGWTPRTGTACTNDDLCATAAQCSDTGSCDTTTTRDCAAELGECVDAMCDPADGACVGDPRADGTACTDDGLACTDDVCAAGVCEHPTQTGSCVADGTCLSDGESPMGNTCVTCDATTDPAILVNAAMGVSCGGALACASASCDGMGACDFAVDPGSCAIDGACFADGTMNPGNRCETCDAANSQTAWTQEAVGTTCNSGVPNCRCGTNIITTDFTCVRPNQMEDCN